MERTILNFHFDYLHTSLSCVSSVTCVSCVSSVSSASTVSSLCGGTAFISDGTYIYIFFRGGGGGGANFPIKEKKRIV